MAEQNWINLLAAQVATLQAAVPLPATVAPPGVTDSSALGSLALYFALADHTHASRIRKQVIQCTAAGAINWTYPTPFAFGISPLLFGFVVDPIGNTDIVDVKQIGTAGSASGVMQVSRLQRGVIVGITSLILQTNPGVTTINAYAVEP